MVRSSVILFILSIACCIVGCDGATISSGAVAKEKDRSAAPYEIAISNVDAANCELRLELPAKIAKKTDGDAKVHIKNAGKSDLTLVMPGDGSDCYWRTPVVGWSFLSYDLKGQHPIEPLRRGGARCGNINALKSDEVFTLKPGETKVFNHWINFPYDLSPGKYRVVFYYSNIPQLKWSGIPLGKHDADAMIRVTQSTGIALVSNEVQLEVTE